MAHDHSPLVPQHSKRGSKIGRLKDATADAIAHVATLITDESPDAHITIARNELAAFIADPSETFRLSTIMAALDAAESLIASIDLAAAWKPFRERLR